MRPIEPALNFPPELLLQAQGVKVAFLDVDGVLTDGGLYFSEQGETLKRFSTLDGHGLKLLKHAGITPVIITGRDSAPLRVRLKALGIAHARFGTEDKLPAAEDYLKTWALPNVFFHVTTAYNILRHNGVPLGKSDYLAGAHV